MGSPTEVTGTIGPRIGGGAWPTMMPPRQKAAEPRQMIAALEDCNCARVCLGPALVEVSEGGPAARGTIHFGIVWRETLFRAM